MALLLFMSAFEVFNNFIQCHALIDEHDKEVEEEIGDFVNDFFFVAVLRGDYGFNCFFADFLDDSIFAFLE